MYVYTSIVSSFPAGTKEFWNGEANQPTLQMWEIVACPVMDVQAYLLDPFRCTFGIPDHDSQSEGSLVEFFKTLNGDAVREAMKKAVVPLAVEFVYNFSGLAFIEQVSKDCIFFLLLMYNCTQLIIHLFADVENSM